jgi:hypothetical protein
MAEQDKSINSPTATCRVFISYSHDSIEHDQRVLALANQLRGDGIDARIDQYMQDPDEGWVKWMRSQVKEAEKALLVFTETYQRRFEGDEEEGKGLGATFEGVIVTQTLYERGGRNAKFRPVVFEVPDERFISDELRPFNRYRVDTPEHYQNLLRWLYEAPRILPPRLGQKANLPPDPSLKLFASESDKPPVSAPASPAESAQGAAGSDAPMVGQKRDLLPEPISELSSSESGKAQNISLMVPDNLLREDRREPPASARPITAVAAVTPISPMVTTPSVEKETPSLRSDYQLESPVDWKEQAKRYFEAKDYAQALASYRGSRSRQRGGHDHLGLDVLEGPGRRGAGLRQGARVVPKGRRRR